MTTRIITGDCREVMAAMEPNSVDAIVCDPPYGLEFMGKAWDRLGDIGKTSHSGIPERDGSTVFGRAARINYNGSSNVRCRSCGKWKWGHTSGDGGGGGLRCQCERPDFPSGRPDQSKLMQQWHETWAREALRVLKPGGHLLAFSGTRTSHRMVCALEDAGFEIRDSLLWIFGSGFAKSWNFKTMYEGDWCGCTDTENAVPYDHDAPQPEHDMRLVWEADLSAPIDDGAERGEVLLPRLPQPSAPEHRTEGSEPEARGAEQSGVEGRFLHRRQGLSSSEDAEPSEGAAERLRPRTRPRRGSGAGATTDAERGSAPSEPRPNGQPAGELAGVRIAPGPLDDGALRDGGRCTRCGKLKAEYKGYGTGLKPAHEPICLARKPLAGTVAANVERYGTGALNIDATRIGTGEDRATGGLHPDARDSNLYDLGLRSQDARPSGGRWPANVLLSHSDGCRAVGTRRVKSASPSVPQPSLNSPTGLVYGFQTGEGRNGKMSQGYADPDGTEEVTAWECVDGCPVAALDAQSGGRKSGAWNGKRNTAKTQSVYGTFEQRDERGKAADTGGASRFFYCAKASRAERNAGLAGMPERTPPQEYGLGAVEGNPKKPNRATALRPVQNHHPTVKPVAVMRWLVRLVTPPGGIILDPFTGSGSTGIAAVLEGFDFIGIEQDAEYVEIAERRIAHVERHGEDWIKAAGKAPKGQTAGCYGTETVEGAARRGRRPRHQSSDDLTTLPLFAVREGVAD
jgi:DNA modification methylase